MTSPRVKKGELKVWLLGKGVRKESPTYFAIFTLFLGIRALYPQCNSSFSKNHFLTYILTL